MTTTYELYLPDPHGPPEPIRHHPLAISVMYPLATTTARIDACNPFKGRRSRAAKLLGITEPSDQPISYEKLLDALGFDDAIWCCRAQFDLSPTWRRYAVWCARQVQHLMTDRRSLDALDVAERHAAGDATDEELATAEDAAEAAAISGALEPDVTWSAATWAAAEAAAAAATADPTYAVIDAAQAAARAAALQTQQAAFRQLVTTGTLP